MVMRMSRERTTILNGAHVLQDIKATLHGVLFLLTVSETSLSVDYILMAFDWAILGASFQDPYMWFEVSCDDGHCAAHWLPTKLSCSCWLDAVAMDAEQWWDLSAAASTVEIANCLWSTPHHMEKAIRAMTQCEWMNWSNTGWILKKGNLRWNEIQ